MQNKEIDNMPKHIAIIMDGNGRWAKKKHLPRIFGHKAGVEKVREIVKASSKLGIRKLTLYAFSTENWKRSKLEVDALMKLLKVYLKNEIDELNKNKVVLSFIGDTTKFSKDIQELMQKSIEATQNNHGMILNLALNYGSRDEIIRAVNKIIESKISTIDEQEFEKYLDTCGQNDPDILIRTSGEMRISNFLLWQIAYSELFFVEKFWPDFTEDDLIKIINEYKKRNRRFGA